MPAPTSATRRGTVPHAVVTPMRTCLKRDPRADVGDAHVARERELGAAADGGAGKRGDDGQGELADRRRQRRSPSR